jgi:hypothetical protein
MSAVGAALLLSGCTQPVPHVAAFRVGDGGAEEQHFVLGPASDPAGSSVDLPGPSAAWATDGAYLAVITVGSGSCPSGPHDITVVADQEIEVRLGDLYARPDVCSADLSPYATVVEVPDGITPDRPLKVHFSRGAVTVPAVPAEN